MVEPEIVSDDEEYKSRTKEARVGDGGRIFPSHMNRQTTPNLWAKKKEADADFEFTNQLMVLGVEQGFLAAFQAFAMTFGTMPPAVGRGRTFRPGLSSGSARSSVRSPTTRQPPAPAPAPSPTTGQPPAPASPRAPAGAPPSPATRQPPARGTNPPQTRRLPSTCFVAGTKVITPNGLQVIESITTSDFVLSIDPSSREKVIQKVSSNFIATASDILDIKIGETLITCSSEHPFWVIGKGWQEAKMLEPGEALLSISGSTVEIDSIQTQKGSFTVFNLEVEGIRTYCVSDLGILVHNKGDVNYSEFAQQLGYTRRISPQKAPFNSHGQPVFSNGRTYITPDIGHSRNNPNPTGYWKMFDRRGRRLGTYDANLNRIGD